MFKYFRPKTKPYNILVNKSIIPNIYDWKLKHLRMLNHLKGLVARKCVKKKCLVYIKKIYFPFPLELSNCGLVSHFNLFQFNSWPSFTSKYYSPDIFLPYFQVSFDRFKMTLRLIILHWLLCKVVLVLEIRLFIQTPNCI